MKVNIAYKTTDAPYGGGNQFLKALKKSFINLGVYSEEDSADIFLFNSHQNVEKIEKLKKKYSSKKFVHRIDGPIRLYNKMSDNRDDIVYHMNQNIADATVFQSVWSKNANIQMGMKSSKASAVIHNAVDQSIFYDMNIKKNTKKRLIAASFSPNIKKGFRFYEFLDKNLDFEKFEFVFAGNSPISFKNITNLGCLSSDKLAYEMNMSDLYVTCSENDPCSNSVLEALSCGLPIVALNSGGHPELIQQAGEYFDEAPKLIPAIEKVINHHDLYSKKIKTATINEITKSYLDFFKEVLSYE